MLACRVRDEIGLAAEDRAERAAKRAKRAKAMPMANWRGGNFRVVRRREREATPVKITAIQSSSTDRERRAEPEHSIRMAKSGMRPLREQDGAAAAEPRQRLKIAGVAEDRCPKNPLTTKYGSAAPARPPPNRCAHSARKKIAAQMRQKFASAPPICRELR